MPVTVIVAARNEEANLDRCLQHLQRAECVIVADSGSHDQTPAIARRWGAEVIQFEYRGGYPKKRQWVLDQHGPTTPWAMLVDADELVTDALWDEIGAAIRRDAPEAAFLATKEFHFLGRRFRFGGFSHAAVLLFRTGRARFENLLESPPVVQDMEVHERLIVDGAVGRFSNALVHEDFKGLDAYAAKHNHYASWEAAVRHQFLTTGRWGRDAVAARALGNPQELRRWLKSVAMRIPFEANLWFFYHYVLRLGFLEGRRGLIASQFRANYIREVRAKVYELSLSERTRFHGDH